MPDQSEKPRPHGDPMARVICRNPEENQSQRDRSAGQESSANGIPAFDEDSGEERRKLYKGKGATLVSRID